MTNHGFPSWLKRASVAVVVVLAIWGLAKVTGMSIWTAVEREDLETIQRYADGGGNLETGAFLWGTTPLFHALKLHRKESYRKLLEVGASPNTLCRRGNVVIHFAAAEKDSYWLRLALDADGDPNLFNGQGYGWIKTTPLIFAIHEGTLENVRLLCDRGADINAMDLEGRTPLRHACESAKFQIVHYLLEKGADYNKPARMPFTFLFCLKQQYPEFYRNYPNEEEKWCRAVFEWMVAHDADPARATWNGTKWTFEADPTTEPE